MRTLLRDILDIDVQLGQPSEDRRGVDGQPVSRLDYLHWRTLAKRAKSTKILQYRDLKEALRPEPHVPAETKIVKRGGMRPIPARRTQAFLEDNIPNASADIEVCEDGTCKVVLWIGERAITIYAASPLLEGSEEVLHGAHA